MLEGHFISLALDPDFAKINMPVYYVWKSVRSHTATLFFTIAGMVFTYLLMRDMESSFLRHERVRKGFFRSLKLLFWGYVLHLDLYWLIKGHFSRFFFAFHVLQCLALVLLSILILYGLYRLFRVVPMHVLMAIVGFICFIIPPTLDAINPESVNPFFREVLDIKAEGARFRSAFPLFPWLGYSLFGGAVGALLRTSPGLIENRRFGFYLIGFGALLNLVPLLLLFLLEKVLVPMGMAPFLSQFYEFGRLGRVMTVIGSIAVILEYKSEIAFFCKKRLAFFFANWFQFGLIALSMLLIFEVFGQFRFNEGFTLSGLGHILLFVGLALLAARLFPWNYELFLKIGQYTLPVYIVHVIILYSGIFGYGLNHLIRKSMEPWVAIGSAVIFILAFVYLVKYIEYFQLSFYRKKREERRTAHEKSTEK